MQVLFIHGLESHPNGSKVRKLREQGFDVVSADMEVSLARLDKRNSFVRSLLATPLMWVFMALFLISIGLGFFEVRFFIVALFVAIAAWFSRETILQRAVARSINNCVVVQAEEIGRVNPDVVIGSSWGGAVALELIRTGQWQGPTILLAPAYQWVFGRYDWQPTYSERVDVLKDKSASQTIWVFHDPTDEVVPISGSEELSNASNILLFSVYAGGHRLMGIVDEGELANAIQKITTR